MERSVIFYVSDRIAGRFTTMAHAQAEEERLCRLAQRDGHAITTRIETQPVEMRDFEPGTGYCIHGYHVDLGVLCPVCDS